MGGEDGDDDTVEASLYDPTDEPRLAFLGDGRQLLSLM